MLKKPKIVHHSTRTYLTALGSFSCLALVASAVAFANPSSTSSQTGTLPTASTTGTATTSVGQPAPSAAKTTKPAAVSPNATAPKPTAVASSGQPAASGPTVVSQPTPASNPAPSPALGLYADPTSQISTGARAYAASNPARAGAFNRLAATPMAHWFGGWNNNVQADVNNYVSSATAANQVPQLVLYNIPNRDCGSFSAGGASDATSYAAWIQAVVIGIGQRPAIVLVEPDALASIPNPNCLTEAGKQARQQMIASAVHTLKTQTGASIYLDAGHPHWQSTDTMASILRSANIAEANGFSLNISNFYTTSDNTSYGNQLSKLVSNKHYVIDTSRNGNGATSDNQWCNPDGRALGQTPTLKTANGLTDAYLWIKGSGESDGTCGPAQAGTSAPSAGAWWPSYADMLLRNTNW